LYYGILSRIASGDKSALLFYRDKKVDTLATLEVGLPVHRDIATGFSYIVDHMGLVHHVPLPERDEMLEVIREQLSADIYPI
jgi:hypothetical protein